MGTRSLTTFIYTPSDPAFGMTPLVSLYGQCDGGPFAHGVDLKMWGFDRPVVNGLGVDVPRGAFNGIGCAAASCIAHFKEGRGTWYVKPHTVLADFRYLISVSCWRLYLKVHIGSRVDPAWAGYLDNFDCTKVLDNE